MRSVYIIDLNARYYIRLHTMWWKSLRKTEDHESSTNVLLATRLPKQWRLFCHYVFWTPAVDRHENKRFIKVKLTSKVGDSSTSMNICRAGEGWIILNQPCHQTYSVSSTLFMQFLRCLDCFFPDYCKTLWWWVYCQFYLII